MINYHIKKIQLRAYIVRLFDFASLIYRIKKFFNSLMEFACVKVSVNWETK